MEDKWLSQMKQLFKHGRGQELVVNVKGSHMIIYSIDARSNYILRIVAWKVLELGKPITRMAWVVIAFLIVRYYVGLVTRRRKV
jgi:hypothetical protein